MIIIIIIIILIIIINREDLGPSFGKWFNSIIC